ncbi:MAG: hypothetical protein Kow0079_02200 [Vicingaceae bacterium]|jgi:hypothetical protein
MKKKGLHIIALIIMAFFLFACASEYRYQKPRNGGMKINANGSMLGYKKKR